MDKGCFGMVREIEQGGWVRSFSCTDQDSKERYLESVAKWILDDNGNKRCTVHPLDKKRHRCNSWDSDPKIRFGGRQIESKNMRRASS